MKPIETRTALSLFLLSLMGRTITSGAMYA